MGRKFIASSGIVAFIEQIVVGTQYFLFLDL